MMIKVNAKGIQSIEAFLKTHASPTGWACPQVQSFVAMIEETNSFVIELDAIETASGNRELFNIPPEGFDLLMTLEEFRIFADNATWTSVNHVIWGMAPLDNGHDEVDEEMSAADGFHNLWRESTVLHESGKLITVVFNEDELWAIRPQDRNPCQKTCVVTWQIDGVDLIKKKGAPCSYKKIHKFFEKHNGKFGFRDGKFSTNLREIDRLSLLPQDSAPQFSKEEDEFSTEIDGKTVKWKSEVLAMASSQDEHPMRWQEIVLKRTSDGTYVCEKDCKSVSDQEPQWHMGGLLKTKSAVMTFFGRGKLATKLYEQAGI